MTANSDIIHWVCNPQSVDSLSVAQLEELVDKYPYCEKFRWMLLRNLYQNDNTELNKHLQLSALHISNPQNLHDYITYLPQPADMATAIPAAIATPDYLTLVQNNSQESLQQLADNLRKARLQRQQERTPANGTAQQSAETTPRTTKSTPENKPVHIDINNLDPELYNEKLVQKLIREKKYSTALQILTAINLNNPKKSVYFALQMRYLETIINNNK